MNQGSSSSLTGTLAKSFLASSTQALMICSKATGAMSRITDSQFVLITVCIVSPGTKNGSDKDSKYNTRTRLQESIGLLSKKAFVHFPESKRFFIRQVRSIKEGRITKCCSLITKYHWMLQESVLGPLFLSSLTYYGLVGKVVVK